MSARKLIIFIIAITCALGGFFVFNKKILPLIKGGEKNVLETEAAPTKTGLVGYWTMDLTDTNGIIMRDMSGTGNNATMYVTATSTGVKRESRSLSGSNSSYINVPNHASINFGANQDFTMSVWVKSTQPAVTNVWPEIFSKEDALGTRQGFGIDLHDSYVTKWLFYIFSGGSFSVLAGANNVADGRWHHLVGIRSGNKLYTYEDGVYVGQAAANTGSLAKDTPINFGKRPTKGGDNYNGLVDEARLYNRALSAEEVAALYNATRIQYVESGEERGLVGYWPMDTTDVNGTTLYSRDGIWNNNGVMTGTSIATGIIKQARNFNGTSDLVFVSKENDKGSLDITKAVTMSAWIYPTSTQTPMTVIEKDYGLKGYALYILDGNHLHADVFNGDATTVASGGTITINQWNFVAGIYDGANIRAYVNGEEVATHAGPASIGIPDVSLRIGAWYEVSNATLSRFFKGKMDDIRLYNYALSDQELKDIYNAAKKDYVVSPTKTGLVGYWTMDNTDRSRGLIYDKSGQNNHGTLVGTATSTGYIGQARTFNGSTDYISAADSNSLKPTSAVTVSIWAKLNSQNNGASCGTAPATAQFVVFKKNSRTGGQTEGYCLYKDDKWYFIISSSGGTQDLAISTDVPQVGQWTHIVGVFNKPNMSIYINGRLQGTDTHNFDLDHSATDLQLGRSGTCEGVAWEAYFNGSLDDVRIYNRALSAQEISQIYNSTMISHK